MNFAIRADPVRRRSARDQHRVEILGGAIGDELFGPHALTVVETALAADALARALVASHDRDDRAGLFQRAARFDQIDLLKPVADQRGDAFSFYCLHTGPVIRAAP